MAEQLAEIDKIANDPAPPTFENTIAALERAGRTLDRVTTFYGIYSSTLSGPEFQAVETEMAPKLAAFSDKITQNEKLFARIAAVYDARETLEPHARAEAPGLARLHELRPRRRAASTPRPRSGCRRSTSASPALFTSFSQNVLADENDYVLVLDERGRPGGPARLGPRRRGRGGRGPRPQGQVGDLEHALAAWSRSSTYSDRRDLREKVWRTYFSRGDNGDAKDNNKIITRDPAAARRAGQAAGLRDARALAARELDGQDAGAGDGADGGGLASGRGARSRGSRRHAGDRRQAKAPAIKIEPWDYRYYAEKVRKAKYDLDQNEVKPYLQLEKLREGMFWVAGQLFGFQFTPVDNVPVCHPDVRVCEVKDAAGKHVGLWYFDPYARPGQAVRAPG